MSDEPGPFDNEDVLEIYAAASALEADRLVLMLTEDGIEAMARATTMSSFPASATSQHLVLVRAADKEKALATIEAARREGAVTMGGEVLG
jgi:hypothetical protein